MNGEVRVTMIDSRDVKKGFNNIFVGLVRETKLETMYGWKGDVIMFSFEMKCLPLFYKDNMKSPRDF